MELSRYKLRYGGKSQNIFSLPERAHLSGAEQMMCALLSRSRDGLEILDTADENVLHLFLDLVSENELTGFVLETIYLLKLEPKIRALSIDHHGTRVDLMTLLTRQSGLEAIKFQKFEKKFLEFLQLTRELNSQIVWFKGIVTSRLYYSSPEYRLSGDFDCFVEPRYFEDLFKTLYLNDFRVIADDTGFCNQVGVGPVSAPADLFLAPSPEFVPSAVCGMQRNHWPLVDIKVNPLDRGLKMIELDRFMRNVISIPWRGTTFSAPDLLDQLLITLTHLEKDRFLGWKQLLDVKLIAEKINETPDLWSEFARRCQIEGVSTACAAGLALAVERLKLQNVERIISQLEPKNSGFLRRILTFTVTPLFYWNASSFLMLLANAQMSDDSRRKLRILWSSVIPSEAFLKRYYSRNSISGLLLYLCALPVHWIVLFLPGGLTRRTVGRFIWSDKQFGVD
ncbi:MAG TPA: nucleotidyltransferase family protein [Drouetiella sp.]